MIDANTCVRLPVVPLRDVVVFPHLLTPLIVGRSYSINALEHAQKYHTKVVVVAQKDSNQDNPTVTDMHLVGCISQIIQMKKGPDNTINILLEGQTRVGFDAVKFDEEGQYFYIDQPELPNLEEEREHSEQQRVMRSAFRRIIAEELEAFARASAKSLPDMVISSMQRESDSEFVDLITAHMPFTQAQKQQLLQTFEIDKRFELLLEFLRQETELANTEKRIRNRVKKQMEKSQRDYYLNEQVKAIQKELGDGEEGADIEEYERRIKAARMSKEAEEKALSELRKLRMMPPMSAEATVVRNYLDVMIDLPWVKKSKINKSLPHAQEVLDADHYGLEKVKDRIIEYLAVQQRVDKVKAPILCLVGAPGVGKTSLGQSIARATNREYVRMALGGVRDEAEIRGHRRTYIGAMPGKILSQMSRAGVRNPLFLLDEIDKMASDFRGDPAAALLEVLDPEQNNTFQDHYLEVDYDLSDVMFVATSNSYNIPAPLLDRMEVISLSGYTEEEKLNIGLQHLVPKQKRLNGLKENEIEILPETIRDIVRYYTSEGGVRSLERELGKICRKVVKNALIEAEKAAEAEKAEKEAEKAAAKAQGRKAKTSRRKAAEVSTVVVRPEDLEAYLGVRKYHFGVKSDDNRVGQVNGLAWTQVGGDLLDIEAVTMPGKGVLQFTGSLGDVMKESMQLARTVVRSRAASLGIAPDIFEKTDIHVHCPEGAVPKEGPSAGIAITTAMVSALTGIPVRADVAMTGEVTLRGEVFMIGGLKEKMLAALRGGIRTILIPQDNVKDLAEIPANVKDQLRIVPVKWIDQVLAEALAAPLTPLPTEAAKPEQSAEMAPIDVVASTKRKRSSKTTAH